MTFNQIVNHFGSQTAAALALGIKPASVCEWKTNGIPIPRQYQIQVLTGGVLRATEPAAKKRTA